MSSLSHDEETIDYYIELIYKYKEEYRLLLYHSQDSSMNNFRDVFIDHMTQISYDYMELEKKYHPQVNKMSDFSFTSCHLSSWMTSILGEIVTHDMKKDEIQNFFIDFFRFGCTGWRELTGIQ